MQRTPINEQIQQDHLAYNLAYKEYTEQLQKFESQVSQPYWETWILLRQVESLLALPCDVTGLSEKQKQQLDSILHQTATNDDNQHVRINNELKSLVAQNVQNALQDQCKQIARLLESTSSDPNGINDIADYIQQQKETLYRMQAGLPNIRAQLTKRITYYLKISLEVLEIMWSILHEFRSTHEMEKNKALDTYYTTMADTLIIRTKLLYISTLLATYDAKTVEALKTLRSILESRLIDARTQLSYAQKRLEKYQEMGPEFETLAGAYFKLLEDIQATQDDIDRIKRD